MLCNPLLFARNREQEHEHPRNIYHPNMLLIHHNRRKTVTKRH